ncbi:hypothetical protein [Halobacteriovorax sp. HLS]|uniref:hypothetical protein n=1 Tax=Halobacteriovorax sp. HLS TaxID=2234000 RepID=UPI000FDC8527|nr:hypothetical protein [Halobacteriovorax sp. HLS]
MKKFLLTLLALSSISALASTPVEIHVPVDNVFSPKGFDSNDNAEVIISGYLPNLCHKAPSTSYKVIGNKIHIDVKALKYHESNPFCPEVQVPFVEAINVGVLDKGLYEIVVNEKTRYEKDASIRIDESSSDAIDDYIYANVEYIERKDNGSRIVELRGYNPSDCFELEEISVMNNGKDVYSILPRMKQVADFCPMKMVPFSYEMEVPNNLKAKSVLLHVRSMQGKSVNSVFPNR